MHIIEASHAYTAQEYQLIPQENTILHRRIHINFAENYTCWHVVQKYLKAL